MIVVASFICLLVVPLAFESVQTSSSPSIALSALKRQKKSLPEGTAALPFLKSQHSSFRERQHEFIKPSSTKKSTEGSPSSFFSERAHLLESQGQERKRGRFSDIMVDDDEDDDGGMDEFENRRPVPQYNIYYKKQQPDPWFPALETRKRYDVDPNREAIDSALKHMAWERLNKRLVKLNDGRESYLDRGERRIRIAKRTPKALEDKDLEAILSDDVSPGTDSNDVNAEQKSTVNKSSISKTVITNTDKQLLPVTTVASVDKVTSKSNQGTASKKEKETKGRQWVPLDSEPTLRSKKSWDDYFGIDKRSSRSYPGQWQVDSSDDNDDNNNDDDNDDEITVNDQELRDFLMQWYVDKMLGKTALRADDEGPEGASENKMKKRKMSDVVEEDDGRRLNGGKEQEDLVEDNDDDDDGSDQRWGNHEEVNVNIPFEEVDDRLRQIEDNILMEATQILENGAAQISHSKEKGNDNSPALTENEVVSHLKAAFNVEKMRDALEDFQDSYSKMQPQQNYGIGSSAVVADDFEDADDDKKKKKKKKRDRNDDKKRADSDMDKKKHKKSMKKKKSIAGQPVKSAAVRTASSKVSAEEEEAQCPVISSAMDYCQELSDALGEMGRLLARPCVKHMLCYTCDNIPTACDSIFLQDAEAICREHFHCQAVASAMRSVFLSNHDEFRHVNRPLCGSDQCLLRLLLTK